MFEYVCIGMTIEHMFKHMSVHMSKYPEHMFNTYVGWNVDICFEKHMSKDKNIQDICKIFWNMYDILTYVRYFQGGYVPDGCPFPG